jgi:hypothetical protein
MISGVLVLAAYLFGFSHAFLLLYLLNWTENERESR